VQRAAAVDTFHRASSTSTSIFIVLAPSKLVTEPNGKPACICVELSPSNCFRKYPAAYGSKCLDVSLAELHRLAARQSDTEATLDMQSAKCPLPASISRPAPEFHRLPTALENLAILTLHSADDSSFSPNASLQPHSFHKNMLSGPEKTVLFTRRANLVPDNNNGNQIQALGVKRNRKKFAARWDRNWNPWPC
jgi:hypothetical protein